MMLKHITSISLVLSRLGTAIIVLIFPMWLFKLFKLIQLINKNIIQIVQTIYEAATKLKRTFLGC